MDKINPQVKNNNRVILFGFGLILAVVAITFLKPVFKNSEKKESTEGPVEVYSDYEYITSTELQEKIKNKEPLSIVDIRDSVNYNEEHIEGAVNITTDKIKAEVGKLNKEILTVIVGYDFEDKNAEAGAVKFFKDSGFTNVKALSGGIFAWKTNLNSTINLGDPDSALDVSKVEKILPEQLQIAIENKYPVVIIDTREENYFSQGHITGAINIPFSELEKRKSEISPTKEVVVYGESELDDFRSAVKVYDMGFLASYIINGGFKSWQEKRYPIERINE